MRYSMRLGISEDSLKGFEVGVNVSENRESHELLWDLGVGIIDTLVGRDTQFLLKILQLFEKGWQPFVLSLGVKCLEPLVRFARARECASSYAAKRRT